MLVWTFAICVREDGILEGYDYFSCCRAMVFWILALFEAMVYVEMIFRKVKVNLRWLVGGKYGTMMSDIKVLEAD